jgi:hypothetical protein
MMRGILLLDGGEPVAGIVTEDYLAPQSHRWQPVTMTAR